MYLPLLVKLGKIRHRQRGGASPWWTAKQGRLRPLFIPILPERVRDSRRFRLVADTRARFRGQSSNRGRSAAAPGLLQISTSGLLWSCAWTNLLAGKRSCLSWGGCLPLCCRASLGPWKLIQRSRSPFRGLPKTVRLHPGIVFTFPGILTHSRKTNPCRVLREQENCGKIPHPHSPHDGRLTYPSTLQFALGLAAACIPFH